MDLRFLDWQIARYATPVTDVVYYIFCCTTKLLRDQYYDDMLQTYHTSLSEMLTRYMNLKRIRFSYSLTLISLLFHRLGSDPAKLFPFDALQDQLRQFGKYGLIMFTLMVPMLTSTADSIPDLDEIAESLQHNSDTVFKPDEAVCHKRMRDVIVDMDRLGYI